MKKINSIKQLQSEKARIAQHQQDLADEIGSNWKELKLSLKPANMAKDIFNSIVKKKTEEDPARGNIFKSILKYGFSLLAKKVSGNLG